MPELCWPERRAFTNTHAFLSEVKRVILAIILQGLRLRTWLLLLFLHLVEQCAQTVLRLLRCHHLLGLRHHAWRATKTSHYWVHHWGLLHSRYHVSSLWLHHHLLHHAHHAVHLLLHLLHGQLSIRDTCTTLKAHLLHSLLHHSHLLLHHGNLLSVLWVMVRLHTKAIWLEATTHRVHHPLVTHYPWVVLGSISSVKPE